jgi:predicted phosphodiesterase
MEITNLNKVANRRQQLRPLKLPGTHFAVISDIHVPFYDHEMWEMFRREVKDRGIPTVLIAGDLFNQDQFSRFPNRFTNDWQKEKREATRLLEELGQLKCCERIGIIPGNHDTRLLKKLAGNDSFAELVRQVLPTKDYGTEVLVGETGIAELGKKWLAFQPKGYSRVPGTVARDMATKYQKHIISTHGHSTSLTFDKSGTHYCIEIGGIPDPRCLEYMQCEPTTHPSWVPGFCVIVNNLPVLCYREL